MFQEAEPGVVGIINRDDQDKPYAQNGDRAAGPAECERYFFGLVTFIEKYVDYPLCKRTTKQPDNRKEKEFPGAGVKHNADLVIIKGEKATCHQSVCPGTQMYHIIIAPPSHERHDYHDSHGEKGAVSFSYVAISELSSKIVIISISAKPYVGANSVRIFATLTRRPKKARVVAGCSVALKPQDRSFNKNGGLVFWLHNAWIWLPVDRRFSGVLRY